MKWFEKRKKREEKPVVQIREGGRHPFGALRGYVPLSRGEMEMYRSVREAMPLLDAAVKKLVRLCGGVTVRAAEGQVGLDRFLREVSTGRGQRGLQSFLDVYLDSMLVCGRGVGEIVLDREGKEIAAVLCADPAQVEFREEDNDPLECVICTRGTGGEPEPLPRQELILFTPNAPEADNPYGVSMMRSMIFLIDILLKIYEATGNNWERMGNARYAVVYKPDEGQGQWAKERGEEIARAWSEAMAAGKDGNIRDFVAVGDVDIKVIGADGQVLDSQVPVRQILEQLVSKTGIPPFLLGLSWSSTERMSAQQVDMLTSEIGAMRRSLTPVVERICKLWLRLHGYADQVEVDWDEISLQDLVEEARAGLYREQAESLRRENGR